MTLNKLYKIKRKALGMSEKEFAYIAQVDEGTITLFEKGDKINSIDLMKIKENVKNYIKSLDKEDRLIVQISECTIQLRMKPENRLEVLSKMMKYQTQLNMMYVGTKEDF